MYPCTTDDDCMNSLSGTEDGGCYNGTRYGGYGSDPNGWSCACILFGAIYCHKNEDCCSNTCQSGSCLNGVGGDGAFCRGLDGFSIVPCAPGCQCIPFENFGYCKC